MNRVPYKVHLTPVERERFGLSATRRGLPFSAWLRSIALEASAATSPVALSDELRSLRHEVSQIGNNINQLTRYAHQNDGAMPHGLSACLSDISAMRARIHTALKAIEVAGDDNSVISD